jgi:hypothetical protein
MTTSTRHSRRRRADGHRGPERHHHPTLYLPDRHRDCDDMIVAVPPAPWRRAAQTPTRPVRSAALAGVQLIRPDRVQPLRACSARTAVARTAPEPTHIGTRSGMPWVRGNPVVNVTPNSSPPKPPNVDSSADPRGTAPRILPLVLRAPGAPDRQLGYSTRHAEPRWQVRSCTTDQPIRRTCEERRGLRRPVTSTAMRLDWKPPTARVAPVLISTGLRQRVPRFIRVVHIVIISQRDQCAPCCG